MSSYWITQGTSNNSAYVPPTGISFSVLDLGVRGRCFEEKRAWFVVCRGIKLRGPLQDVNSIIRSQDQRSFVVFVLNPHIVQLVEEQIISALVVKTVHLPIPFLNKI
jgi:hypothetical protein